MEQVDKLGAVAMRIRAMRGDSQISGILESDGFHPLGLTQNQRCYRHGSSETEVGIGLSEVA